MLAGYVCLVGAGPGNSGLVTRRGMSYLQRADVILYDHLIPWQILLEAAKDCELIDAGKEGGGHSVSQEEINNLMIARARAGKFVVRLKGGDPFLMGRGGEEAKALVEAGVPYIMVPGVSSSYAVPAYSGIPVTERGLSAGVTISTGHKSPSSAGKRHTEVYLMGLADLDGVVSELAAKGLAMDTPVSVISRGTTLSQKTVTGELGNIVHLVREARLQPPALVVAGEVVGLQKALSWRHNLPLANKRILLTRPFAKEEPEILKEIELYGAEVIRFPTIEIKPETTSLVAEMLPEIREHSWVVFSSVTAVEVFFNALLYAGRDWRYLEPARIAVIGAKTGQALQERGRMAEFTASDSTSDGLLQLLLQNVSQSETLALCRAKQTLPVLADGLSDTGIGFKEFGIYEVVAPVYDIKIAGKILSDPLDAVIFTSPLTVTNFWQLAASVGYKPEEETKYACLGKETAAALKKAGYQPWLVPEKTSLEALVELILAEWGVT